MDENEVCFAVSRAGASTPRRWTSSSPTFLARAMGRTGGYMALTSVLTREFPKEIAISALEGVAGAPQSGVHRVAIACQRNKYVNTLAMIRWRPVLSSNPLLSSSLVSECLCICE